MPIPMNPEKKAPSPTPEKQGEKTKTGTSWGTSGTSKPEPVKQPKPGVTPKK